MKGLSVGDGTMLLVVNVAADEDSIVVEEARTVLATDDVDRRQLGGTGQIVLVTYTTVVTMLGDG